MELHQLMNQGGLDGATKLMEQCFDMKTGRAKEKGNNSSFPSKVTKFQTNNNSNARVKPVTDLKRKLSEETVYQRAVPKRFSSSSEEEEMEIDTSDEFPLERGYSKSGNSNFMPTFYVTGDPGRRRSEPGFSGYRPKAITPKKTAGEGSRERKGQNLLKPG